MSSTPQCKAQQKSSNYANPAAGQPAAQRKLFTCLCYSLRAILPFASCKRCGVGAEVLLQGLNHHTPPKPQQEPPAPSQESCRRAEAGAWRYLRGSWQRPNAATAALATRGRAAAQPAQLLSAAARRVWLRHLCDSPSREPALTSTAPSRGWGKLLAPLQMQLNFKSFLPSSFAIRAHCWVAVRPAGRCQFRQSCCSPLLTPVPRVLWLQKQASGASCLMARGVLQLGKVSPG